MRRAASPTTTRRGQTAEAYLPASNALSSLRSVTTTPRGLVCRTSSTSFFLGLAVGGCVRLSPSTVRPLAASGPRVRGHSRFSPAAYGSRAGHLSVQHFTLHQPKQGRRGLSFVVEVISASRPFRHPIFPCVWERLPGVSLWVLRTIRSGYTL